MNRRNILAFVGVMTVVALAAIPADARTRNSSATGQKIYKSWKCGASVQPYDFRSWACTTIIVPQQVNSGEMTAVTFMFKAKTTLKYVDVCFSKIVNASCAYKHSYLTIKPGTVIKRVLQLSAPTVSGTYQVSNYTRFYKLPKYAHRDAYWSVRSPLCVTADGDQSSQCSVWK